MFSKTLLLFVFLILPLCSKPSMVIDKVFFRDFLKYKIENNDQDHTNIFFQQLINSGNNIVESNMHIRKIYIQFLKLQGPIILTEFQQYKQINTSSISNQKDPKNFLIFLRKKIFLFFIEFFSIDVNRKTLSIHKDFIDDLKNLLISDEIPEKINLLDNFYFNNYSIIKDNNVYYQKETRKRRILFDQLQYINNWFNQSKLSKKKTEIESKFKTTGIGDTIINQFIINESSIINKDDKRIKDLNISERITYYICLIEKILEEEKNRQDFLTKNGDDLKEKKCRLIDDNKVKKKRQNFAIKHVKNILQIMYPLLNQYFEIEKEIGDKKEAELFENEIKKKLIFYNPCYDKLLGTNSEAFLHLQSLLDLYFFVQKKYPTIKISPMEVIKKDELNVTLAKEIQSEMNLIEKKDESVNQNTRLKIAALLGGLTAYILIFDPNHKLKKKKDE